MCVPMRGGERTATAAPQTRTLACVLSVTTQCSMVRLAPDSARTPPSGLLWNLPRLSSASVSFAMTWVRQGAQELHLRADRDEARGTRSSARRRTAATPPAERTLQPSMQKEPPSALTQGVPGSSQVCFSVMFDT